ncbi:hypothetical protein OHB14_61460 [Streptomyces sp. NBC_01613]|uniref:hypothetical protein n=1 Tax=Streptomyces sp. NBC_01613 TaxID=2975896 RepID=UPI00386A2E9E
MADQFENHLVWMSPQPILPGHPYALACPRRLLPGPRPAARPHLPRTGRLEAREGAGRRGHLHRPDRPGRHHHRQGGPRRLAPIEHFKDIEANTQANYPTYHRLRLHKTTFKEHPASVWEFTFHGRARAVPAMDLGYGTESGRECDIYLSAPDARWDTYRPVFDTVRERFAY